MAARKLAEFADKMNEVMPVLIQGFARRQANELYKGKITLPQFLILDFLNKKGECKMTEIARFMHVSTAAMTGIVERIKRCNYVERVYEPSDRRIIKVRLTYKGRELVKKVNRQRRNMIVDIFAKISQREREQYLNILMRILNIMTEEK